MGIGADYDDDDYDNDYDDETRRKAEADSLRLHELVTCISDQVEEHNPLIGQRAGTR